MVKDATIDKKLFSLIHSVKSMMISIDNNGKEPVIGYLPFIEQEGEIYIFPSSLSIHGKMLLDTPPTSVMFIEDEANAKLLPARLRAFFTVNIEPIDTIEAILQRFEDEIDESYATMRYLTDFQMYRLTLKVGRYVQGFGAAFEKTEEGWNHIN